MLQEAKASIQSQSVPTETIVVTDEEARGPAWARNVGLERADTRYVAFLDADDLWREDKLQRQLAELDTTGAGLCVEGATRSTAAFVRALFVGDIRSLTSSILLDTEAVSLRFEESLERYEDHLFLLEAASAAGVCFCEELVKIRKQSTGLSSRTDKQLLVEQREAFRELALDRVPATRQHLSTFDARLAYDRGRQYHQQGQYRRAIGAYRTSLGTELHAKPVVALGLSLVVAVLTAPRRL
jgi:glycosyltransferase involved in cell wall biosynthesis